MASKQKPVMFDFDGVLVNTLDMALAINQEIRPAMTREEYLHKHEGNVLAAFDTLSDAMQSGSIFWPNTTNGCSITKLFPRWPRSSMI